MGTDTRSLASIVLPNGSRKRARFADPGALRTGITGAVGELLACVDLARKGFHVFRAVAPSCPCDLLAMAPDGQCWRIEVRTATLTKSGTCCFSIRAADECDVYAVVSGDTVAWLPSTEWSGPFPWPITDEQAMKAQERTGREAFRHQPAPVARGPIVPRYSANRW